MPGGPVHACSACSASSRPCWPRPRRTGAQSPEGFRFRSGVDLVNVTATVTDDDGRFVSGLRREDFTRLRGRQAAGRLALQQRAGAGEPGHRARRQRQHDAGQDVGGTIGHRSLHLRSARQGRRAVLRRVRHRAALTQDWTTDRRLISRAVRDVVADRRHGDLRRGRDGDSDRTGGHAPEEGAARHLRRQRHQQHDRRSASCGSRFARAKCSSTRSASTAPAGATPTLSDRRSQIPFPIPFPFPGGRRPDPRPAADRRRRRRHDVAQRTRRPGERRCAAADHRRHRRPHRDRARLRGIGLGHRADRRRIEQAVLPGLFQQRRTDGRWHSIRVAVRDRRLTVRARRGYVAS